MLCDTPLSEAVMTTGLSDSAVAPPSQAFSTRTPELSMRAARAASQIDRLMQGHAPDANGAQPVVDALSGFVGLLNQLDLHNPTASVVKSFLDPTSSRVLVRASQQAKIAEKIDSYGELNAVLLRVLDMLDQASSKGLNAPELEKLRDFFIYLSDFAAAESRTFVTRPKQPYRR